MSIIDHVIILNYVIYSINDHVLNVHHLIFMTNSERRGGMGSSGACFVCYYVFMYMLYICILDMCWIYNFVVV